jgi:hypothetical protein
MEACVHGCDIPGKKMRLDDNFIDGGFIRLYRGDTSMIEGLSNKNSVSILQE